MLTHRSILRIARSTTMGLLISGSIAAAYAQQAVPTSTAPAAQAPLLLATLDAPANLVSGSDFAYSSSSSSVAAALEADKFSFASDDATQPPPRRRYGRPNYSDSHTNKDGSSKFAFMGGAGIALPTQDTHTYLTPNFAVQVGAGRNFSKMYGLLVQFDYDRFGFQGSTLNAQSNLYFGATNQGLDGNSHVWSFTLNPVVNFYGTGNSGVYAIGGVGFYHKTANFTVPATGEYCDPYYGCYEYQANETFDKYTSNAAGINGGLGFTYKPSRFSSERFYVESRYVYVFNSPRAYSLTNNNYYPPNANRTSYVPVTFGLRF